MIKPVPPVYSAVPQPTNFRTSIVKIAPPWLQGYWGNRFLYSIGTPLDGVQSSTFQGIEARMPGVGTTDALPFIGNDKQILRGFDESDEAYIVRLRAALDTWKLAGNAISIITQLVGYVSPAVPMVRYVVNGFDPSGTFIADWVTVLDGAIGFHRADPSNWDWDGVQDQRRFWIIIYPGVWTMRTWNDGGTYGDGQSWGSTASPTQVKDIRSLVKKWKAAGTYCKNIILAGDASYFDPGASPGAPMPDGTWGEPWKIVGGTAVPSRQANALYWAGVPLS